MPTLSDSIPLHSARSQIQHPHASSLRFDWIATLLSCWLVGGLFLDGWAHNHGRVDDTFFTPWHSVLYSGAAAMVGFLAINQWRNVNKGYAWRWALPQGYMLSLVGAILFVLGGGLDLIWHTLFGFEVDVETLLSPVHLFLAGSGILMTTGPIRSAWSQFSSDARLGWPQLGAAVISAALLLSVLTFFTNFAHPITRVNDIFTTPPTFDTAWHSALYVMNADGTGQTRVNYQPGLGAWSGDWSPDGSQIVTSLSDADTYNDDVPVSNLYIMDVDGRNSRQLTDMEGTEYLPSWSPDGTKIAFINNLGGQQVIYTINVDGSELTALTDNTSKAYMPVWSPDGQQIVFNSDRSGVDYLYVMNADGSGVRELVNQGLYNWGARWSPDGSQIVFHSVRDNNTDIYIIGADGSGETRLTTSEIHELTPSWSPDGQSILFSTNQNGVTDIYRINADGSGLVNLSQNPTLVNQFPVWSPDGSKVLYTSSAYSAASNGMSKYNRETTGIVSVLVQAVLMSAIVMVLVRRWTLPFGSLTVILGLNAALMSVLNDQYQLIPPAVIAGLIADVLLFVMKPAPHSQGRYYGFAFAFPAVYYALFFVTVQLTQGIEWTIHLWLGAIVVAGIIGMTAAFMLRLAASPSLRYQDGVAG